MADPLVTRGDEGPVAVLTLNRPEKRNALSRALMDELEHQIDRAAHDPKVCALVLTGAGGVFCAGMDLREAARRSGTTESEHDAVVALTQFADLVQKLHALPRPTITALNGDALASGACLATACDFVIAEEQAHIGYPEVLHGLVPAVVMFDLSRLLGDRRARQLLLTGEPIPASQACSWGLINQVVQRGLGLAEAIRLGREMTRLAPEAVAAIKRLLDETEGRPRSLRGAAAISAAIHVSEEAREGIRAFLDKRPPSWRDRG